MGAREILCHFISCAADATDTWSRRLDVGRPFTAVGLEVVSEFEILLSNRIRALVFHSCFTRGFVAAIGLRLLDCSWYRPGCVGVNFDPVDTTRGILQRTAVATPLQGARI